MSQQGKQLGKCLVNWKYCNATQLYPVFSLLCLVFFPRHVSLFQLFQGPSKIFQRQDCYKGSTLWQGINILVKY